MSMKREQNGPHPTPFIYQQFSLGMLAIRLVYWQKGLASFLVVLVPPFSWGLKTR